VSGLDPIDVIDALQQRSAVREQNQRSPFDTLENGFQDRTFRTGVQVGSWLIQDHDGRVFEQDARQRHTAALATTQANAIFPSDSGKAR
jgi:hypothetical protein